MPGVWKRRPGNRGALLLERSIREQFSNLKYLAGGVKLHGSPRPEPLHRILARVASPDDWELALRGVSVLRQAGTTFTPLTAHLAVQAARRARTLDAVIGLLRHPRTSGIAPVGATLRSLVKAAADTENGGSAELLTSVTSLIWAGGVQPDAELASLLVWAWSRLGRIDKALPIYGKLRVATAAVVSPSPLKQPSATSEASVALASPTDVIADARESSRQPAGGSLGAALDARPVYNVLRAASSIATPLPLDVATVLTRFVLPDARALGRPEIDVLVALVEERLQPGATAAASSSQAAAQ